MSGNQDDRGWRDHVAVIGSPGSGKIVWAREQARRVPFREWESRSGDGAYMARVCGIEDQYRKGCGITPDGFTAPFRAPHHSVSLAALIGSTSKGWKLRPGEVSLAHGGVLLLDEATEYKLEAIRAIADIVKKGRSDLATTLTGPVLPVPAEFRLVVACNPCPCGWRGDAREDRRCKCTDKEVSLFMGRLGPLFELCRVVPRDEWQREVKEICRRREAQS